MYEQEASRRGLLIYPTFRSYVDAVNPDLLKYEHVPQLVDVGERIVSGLLSRVLVMLPPRYFKSEIFGRLLSAYYLLRHPTRSVGLTSFEAGRAWEVSEAAQRYFQRGYGLVGGTEQARRLWKTPSGGQLWAIGMGGALLGWGYHLGIIDDPIRPQDVRSLTYQHRFTNWWSETWLSRQEPVPEAKAHGHIGQVVLVMQRLGPEDPIDFLLRAEVGEKTEAAPQHWHVVVMDEIKSEEALGRWTGPRGLPATCTLEPDTRAPGAVLAPSRLSVELVAASHKGTNPMTVAAQRQQRPMAPTGAFWRSAWFQGCEYDQLPETAYNGGWDWDTALTKDEANSATAGVQSYRGPPPAADRPDEFPIYINAVWWDWLEFPPLVKHLLGLKGPHYVEAKASGKSAVQTLATYGIKAMEVPVVGDKLSRASAVQPTVSNGRIFVHKSVIQKLLWGERQGLLRVTAEGLQLGDEGLDVNDAFVQALTRHLGINQEKRRKVQFA
jgi:hypothetical protein